MAKKKAQNSIPSTSEGPSRVTTAIENAENGFVVHATSEGGPDKAYKTKTFVAPDHTSALRIAAQHLASCGPKGKGKTGKGGKGKSKIAISKRG